MTTEGFREYSWECVPDQTLSRTGVDSVQIENEIVRKALNAHSLSECQRSRCRVMSKTTAAWVVEVGCDRASEAVGV